MTDIAIGGVGLQIIRDWVLQLQRPRTGTGRTLEAQQIIRRATAVPAIPRWRRKDLHHYFREVRLP